MTIMARAQEATLAHLQPRRPRPQSRQRRGRRLPARLSPGQDGDTKRLADRVEDKERDKHGNGYSAAERDFGRTQSSDANLHLRRAWRYGNSHFLSNTNRNANPAPAVSVGLG